MSDMEVTERITNAGPQLTAAERRVAQAVLERPQLVAFGTVADLATHAKAGAATVVRLAGKLGFDGFSSLQSSVQADLSRQLRPPVERIRELADHQPVERHRAIATSNLVATLDSVGRSDLERVVTLLSDGAGRFSCSPETPSTGSGCSSFTTSARCERVSWSWPGTRSLSGGSWRRANRPRPCSSSICAATSAGCSTPSRCSRDAGHTIVALSDGPLSPLAMAARYSFTLAAHSASPFDSHIATLALLELLVAGAAERLREVAGPRLERAEAAWAAAGALSDR